ncbi:hypothetical protein SE17_25015 [Kouleothrix aurantiaca]|uniref:GAF domain-containing protein n=1 Tax=Kouleothrix aurantiaca TaxID=186479 RepID=A0A0P9DDG3_9CHLR|nr:hypothetical protein SE17_25015 [Kouleothrix aurantiaca]
MHTPQPGQQQTHAVVPAHTAAPTDMLSTLHQFALDLVSRPVLGDALAQALRPAAQLTGSPHATLLVLDAAGQISYRVALDNGNLAPLAMVAQPMMRRGLAGWVARERRATLVRDTANDERWLPGPGLGDLRSAAAVPISYHERVLGILTVGHELPEHYDAEQLNMLEIIGAQIALALELAERDGLSPRPAAPPCIAEMVMLAVELPGLSAVAHRAPGGFAGLICPFFQTVRELAARRKGIVAAIGGDAAQIAFSAEGGALRAVVMAAELTAASQHLGAGWQGRNLLALGSLNIGIGDGLLMLGTLPTVPPARHASGVAAARAQRLCELSRGDVLVTQGVAAALAGHRAIALQALPPLRLDREVLPIFHLAWRVPAATHAPHAGQHGLGAELINETP